MVSILPPGSFSVSQDWFYSFKCVEIEVRSPPRFCLRSSSVSLCTTPLGHLIRKYTGIKYHFYADDTQLFIHLFPDDSLKSLDCLKSCLNDIQVWMSENKLKLNPDKTEFIVSDAKDRYKWLSDSFPVYMLGNCLSPTDVAHNLGVLLSFVSPTTSILLSNLILLASGTFIVSGGFFLLIHHW